MIGAEPDCPGCPEKTSASRKSALERMPRPDTNRVLVTGAGGFVGRRLCEALSEKGYALRVLVRNDAAEELFKSLKAEIYTGDIRDPDVVDWACDGAAGVFHLASVVQQAGIPDKDFWDTHVTATKHLLCAAKKYDVRRVTHCSTIGVLGHIADPPADETAPYNVEDIYQITKAEGEKLALEFYRLTGLPVTVVRPTAVYGPGDTRLLKLFRLVAAGKFKMIGNGETLIHPVFVDDLVEGMIRAHESGRAIGETYIIGGERSLPLKEWVEIIAAAAGVKLSRLTIPYWPVRAAAALCEALCKPLRIEPPLFRRRVDFFIKNRAFSIQKAKDELGYTPKVSLEDGARKTLDWCKQRGWIT